MLKQRAFNDFDERKWREQNKKKQKKPKTTTTTQQHKGVHI